MAKFVINNKNIECVFISNNNTCIYFTSGKFLTLPEYKIPDHFVKFTDKIYVNPKCVLYIKNNTLENKNTPKITIVVNSKEIYCKYTTIDEMWKEWERLKQMIRG